MRCRKTPAREIPNELESLRLRVVMLETALRLAQESARKAWQMTASYR